jgi:hypothetical protein
MQAKFADGAYPNKVGLRQGPGKSYRLRAAPARGDQIGSCNPEWSIWIRMAMPLLIIPVAVPSILEVSCKSAIGNLKVETAVSAKAKSSYDLWSNYCLHLPLLN